jgi:hypothetical protein
MAELGKPDGWYFAPSMENVNCENPRGKPVLQPAGPNWALGSGFCGVFLRSPQKPRILHRMYTARQPFRLAQHLPEGAKSKQVFGGGRVWLDRQASSSSTAFRLL